MAPSDPSVAARQRATLDHILLTCTGIVNLVLDVNFVLELLPKLNRMRLQRLGILVPSSPSEWARAVLGQDCFATITHLSLFQPPGAAADDDGSWSQLACMPSLTHLSLSENLARAILLSTLVKSHQLRVVLALFCINNANRRARTFAQDLTIHDPRIVLCVMFFPNEDWEAGARRGGNDKWERPMNSLLGSGAVKLRVIAILSIIPLSRRIFPSLLRPPLKLQRSPHFQYDSPASVRCGDCRTSKSSERLFFSCTY
ncbi:hypothetical protein DFH06DRAFT_1488460 [Mycena polygramma]|nr:hypothetical protein DFH06DRAFT_1488460 [Mycena polygramma]